MALTRMGYDAIGMDLIVDQFPPGRLIADANDVPFAVLGGDASALPFPDASFDAVTMVETFEHIFLDDRPRALAECRRVLRAGGLLVLSTPNYGSVVERFKRLTGRHGWLRERLPTMCYPEEGTARGDYHPYRYHRPLPDREVIALMRGAGFEDVRVRHFLFMLKNTPSSAYGVARAVERLAEAAPGLRRLGATSCFVARSPGNQGKPGPAT
jgi:SAM-dependent methyltransferase